ncbi:MAG TPA: DNA cytosine methyltransferase [Rhizomicrobium sp.]
MVTTEGPPCFVDVFAGCGGLSLGLKRAGWKGLFAIEKDAFAFETLNANFGGTEGPLTYSWPTTVERKRWDIRRLIDTRPDALRAMAGKVDLIAGGPPCQGFSHAGRRRLTDPRNKLFEAYLELVDILLPKLVLVENVRGFTSDFKAKRNGAIKNFASTLEEKLSKKYDITFSVIKASDFGVPQARPRFFLIGVRKDLGQSALIESFFADLSRHSKIFLGKKGLSRSPSARDAISDLEIARNGMSACAESNGFMTIDYKSPITAFQKAMHEGHDGAPSGLRLARHRDDISRRFGEIIKTCREEGRLNVNLSAETKKAHKLKKAALRVLDPLSPAPTITSLPDDLLHYSEPRTLTVRENARLQTFPDWFTFHGKYTTGGHLRRKEVPRFTQVANAVPPLLAEQIGSRLLEILLGCKPIRMSTKSVANDRKRQTLSTKFAPKLRHPRVIDRNRRFSTLDRSQS